ncbi:ALF repeat-containing protein [Amycolatopsis balhimycina]|uniref:ALF repeat-containing protein n=1 Tax=Amycolatopsis balhimycina TaxID=208443 RepID=UPI000367C817|nr:ALF repeat-containing protein [Amycolatopsis balhimycina]
MRANAVIVAAALAAGVFAAPAAADVLPDRAQAVSLLETGGPGVARAAEAALLGSPADLQAFLATGRQRAQDDDERVLVAQALSAGGPVTKRAAQQALSGTQADIREFLAHGLAQARIADDRIAVGQAMSTGGPTVNAAAQKALDGTPADVRAFLETGLQQAKDIDERITANQALAAGGPEVKAAAQTALDGTPDDVRYFLSLWRKVAADGDAEIAAVKSEVDFAKAAAARHSAIGVNLARSRANTIANDARTANTNRLAAQRAKGQQDGRAAAAAEAAAQQQAREAAARAAQAKADNDKLLADAADPALTVPNGRRASAYLLRNGGAAVKNAARAALSGSDDDVVTFVRSGLAVAQESDDRAAVAAIAADASARPGLRQAARDALAGPYAGVAALLRTGDYPGRDTDDRVEVNQIMAAGGPATKSWGQQALDGTVADVREFLAHGQHDAHLVDLDIYVTRTLSDGPEVDAVAQGVLDGPRSGLQPYLDNELPRARARDAFTAQHVAKVNALLAQLP